jgi:hypothetical protein
LEGIVEPTQPDRGIDDRPDVLHVTIPNGRDAERFPATLNPVLFDRGLEPHRLQFRRVLAFARHFQRQVLDRVHIVLQVYRCIAIDRSIAHQNLECVDPQTDGADRCIAGTGLLADVDVLVFQLTEQRRHRGLDRDCCSRLRWIAGDVRDWTLHGPQGALLLDCGIAVDALQDCELPIGNFGQLADCVRQGRVARGYPLTGAQAIPDILAQQVGARRHRRMAGVTLADLLLDHDAFLEGSELAHDGRREHRPCRGIGNFGGSVLKKGEHIGEEFLGAVSLRKANIARRKISVSLRIHLVSPLLEASLSQRAEPRGALLCLLAGKHAKPHPNRRTCGTARSKTHRGADLEEIRG